MLAARVSEKRNGILPRLSKPNIILLFSGWECSRHDTVWLQGCGGGEIPNSDQQSGQVMKVTICLAKAVSTYLVFLKEHMAY